MPVTTRGSVIKNVPKVAYSQKSEALQQFMNTSQSPSESGPQSPMQIETSVGNQEEPLTIDLTVDMQDAESNATTQSSPTAPAETGVIIAREGDNCLIYFPVAHVLEYTTYGATVGKGYKDKVDPNDSKFNSSNHVGILKALKTDTDKIFPSLADVVMTTEPNHRNQCTTGIVLNGKLVSESQGTALAAGTLYRMSKSNAITLLGKKRYDEKNNKGPELNTSDRTPALPTKSLESARTRVQRKDTLKQSTETKETKSLSPAVCDKNGVIVAKENNSCLVYFNKGLEYMDYQKARDMGLADKFNNTSNTLNSKQDETDLQQRKTKLEKEEVGKFRTKIKSVFTSQKYGNRRRSTAIKLNDDERIYIMAKTNAEKILTKADFDVLNEYLGDSDVSQDDAKNTSQSVIPTVEIRSSALKPQENTEMKTPQEARGNYTILGKNLMNPQQKVNDDTVCMVCDEKGDHMMMLWSNIIEAQDSGRATFDDRIPNSNGIHSRADRDFLGKVKENKQSTKIVLEGGILWNYQSKANKTVWCKTVFSRHKDNEKMEELYEKRRAYGDYSEGPIRSSASAFVGAGQSKANLDKELAKWYPELWEEYNSSLKKGFGRDRSVTPEDHERLEQRHERLEQRVQEMYFMFHALVKASGLKLQQMDGDDS